MQPAKIEINQYTHSLITLSGQSITWATKKVHLKRKFCYLLFLQFFVVSYLLCRTQNHLKIGIYF